MINLRLATTEDAEFISKLHYQYIPTGFFNSLGVSFLKLMYQSMVNSEYAFCIVTERGKIPKLWDGKTDERIVKILVINFNKT